MLSPEFFCYWLQGFFELYDENSLTEFQLNRIKQELGKVFTHPPSEPPPTSYPYPCPSTGSPYIPSLPQINSSPIDCTGIYRYENLRDN